MADTGAVFQLLAESRTREKAQTLFYRALAAEAESAGKADESERLNELHADEQHHLSRATARLLELGGTAADLRHMTMPVVSLAGWEEAARARERDEISWYEHVLEGALDADTHALVEEILESERHHHAELRGKWMSATTRLQRVVPPPVRPEAPPAVRWITRTLEDAGYETWAVGGAVRDVLAGLPSGDWDLTTRARPADVRRIFPRTVPIGVEHGTVGVLARDGTLYEVTTFRRDVSTTGRHAVVEFADRVEDDLARRDFTINALAWHPLREELLDPFGGGQDLQDRLLRTVGEPKERFAEDYLRVLRALRFAGRFHLEVHPPTWRALVAATGRLDILSRERIREELMKVLGGDPHPARALGLYRASGVLESVAPELAALAGVPLPDADDPERDAWSYAVAAAGALPSARPLLRLAALLQSLGIPGPPPVHWRSELAAARAAAFLIRLRFSNAQIDRVTSLVRAGPHQPANRAGATLRRWLAHAGLQHLPDLTRLWIARARALGDDQGERARELVATWRALRTEVRGRPPLRVADLAIGGRELMRLGMKPSPRFRTVLEDLLARVLEDPALNEPDVLAAIVLKRLESESEAPAGPGGEPEERTS